MSDLGTNDLVLLLHRRVLRNLAISVDHAVESSVGVGVLSMAAAAAFCPDLATWLARGLEHPAEQGANLIQPVPRLLYATVNPAFNPAAGANPLDSLLKFLDEFDDAAAGPVRDTLSPGDTICGFPIVVPCPISFKEDPGNRITFLRDEFFQNDADEFVEVVPEGVLITVKGNAYRGDLFSRDRALISPTHSFTMKLRYQVSFINDSDVAFGRVPFKMVADPPPASQPGLPRLPKKGEFIFASTPEGMEENEFLLPSLVPFDGMGDDSRCKSTEGCQPPGLTGQFFQGTLDDVIYDTLEGQPFEPVPRYRVEPRSEAQPECLVLRQIGDPDGTILAEGQGGRLVLQYVKVESLDMAPLQGDPGLTAGEVDAVSKSLTKINPTLSQAFRCAAGLDSQKANLSNLVLLGTQGLDIPMLPQNIVLPQSARIITSADTADISAGFPENSTRAVIIHTPLTAAKQFPGGGTFGVGGRIDGTGAPDFNDFSNGRDLSAGVSQTFLQPMLDLLGQSALEEIKKESIEGLDPNSLQVTGVIGDGKFKVRVTGQGEIETPFFLPNIGFDVTVDWNLRLWARKGVLVKGDGTPVDRFGCPIPAEVLQAKKLDLANRVLELPVPELNPDGTPEENPLSFLGYWDPDDGIACFDRYVGGVLVEACPVVTRVPPPVLDAAGNEVAIDDPENPPNLCEDSGTPEMEQMPDQTDVYGQASWGLPENEGGLKHVWGLAMVPPSEDDVDVDVSVDLLVIFLAELLVAFSGPAVIGALALLGPAGLALAPLVIVVGLTAAMVLPLTNVVAGIVATHLVAEKLKEQHRELGIPELAPVPFLAIYMEEDDPDNPPFALQGATAFPPAPGALIVRSHVVVQSAGLPINF